MQSHDPLTGRAGPQRKPRTPDPSPSRTSGSSLIGITFYSIFLGILALTLTPLYHGLRILLYVSLIGIPIATALDYLTNLVVPLIVA